MGGCVASSFVVAATTIVLLWLIIFRVMTTVLKDFETKLQIQITCLCETEALGSAGSLAFAKEKLL
ncbi:hypothetical protein Scep_015536 [Stephania cephalantha]|uniref:Uncharacterized protein n=1 Tax=Stephania cephalantha TaxID=152367 RepID=A0AAP0J4S9_9MAGN